MLKTIEKFGDSITFSRNPPQAEYSFADLARMHEGCIVLSRGKKLLVGRKFGMDQKSGRILVRAIDPYVKPLEKHRYMWFDLMDNHFPEFGYYNLVSDCGVGRTILIDRKTSRRQWRLGFHASICGMSTPYFGKYGTHMFDQMFRDVTESNKLRIPLNRMDALYLSTTLDCPTFEAAKKMLESRKAVSVAVSRKMAIALSPFDETVGVFLMGHEVAQINPNGSLTILREWATDSIMEVYNA